MPTLKQKKTFKFTLENGGRVSKAMKKAGYSDAMARNPQKLTEANGWKELMQAYLPDESLARKHQELLNNRAIDHMVFPVAMTDGEITDMVESIGCRVKKIKHGKTVNHVWFFTIDAQSAGKALDMAYKLKGLYAAEKTANVNLNLNADIQLDPKAYELRDRYEKELFDQLND